MNRDQESSGDLPDRIESLYRDDKLGEALLLSDVLCRTDKSKYTAVQHLVIETVLQGRKKEHRKVLGVDDNATQKEISQSYKCLAQKVHPDKCKAYGAEEAFQHVNEAAKVLQSTDGGFVKETDKEQHAWWEAWDGDASNIRKRKREEAGTLSEKEELEILHLRQCAIEDLKKEVAERQRAVLRPVKDSVEAKMKPAERQQRVRTARGILNERLANVHQPPKKQSGFL